MRKIIGRAGWLEVNISVLDMLSFRCCQTIKWVVKSGAFKAKE